MEKLRFLPETIARRVRPGLRVALKRGAELLLVILWLWAMLAILYSNLPVPFLRATLALMFGVASPAAFIFLPRRRAVMGFVAAVFCILLWWLLIPPSNDRDWSPDQAILPYAEVNGDSVTIRNIRNCLYRTTEDISFAITTRHLTSIAWNRSGSSWSNSRRGRGRRIRS